MLYPLLLLVWCGSVLVSVQMSHQKEECHRLHAAAIEWDGEVRDAILQRALNEAHRASIASTFGALQSSTCDLDLTTPWSILIATGVSLGIFWATYPTRIETKEITETEDEHEEHEDEHEDEHEETAEITEITEITETEYPVYNDDPEEITEITEADDKHDDPVDHEYEDEDYRDYEDFYPDDYQRPDTPELNSLV